MNPSGLLMDSLYFQIGPEAQDSANYIEYLRRDSEITREVAKHIATLWKDKGIRATFELRGRLSVPDSCAHFFDIVKKVASPEYMPSDKDILLVRKRTTGIIEEHFVIKGMVTTLHLEWPQSTGFRAGEFP